SDSKSLFFNADDKGSESIFKVSVQNKKIEPLLTNGYNTQLRSSPDGKSLVFLRENLNTPAELFRMDFDGKNLRQLTRINAARAAQLDMSPKEDFWFDGAGGTKVHGWIIKPPDFSSTKKYPLVYLIHGGPQGQWGDQFHYRWNAQMFASRGYVVAMVNPRGSTGYGQKFTDEITQDWGGKVYDDLMKGVDHIIKAYSFVDANRLTAAGASYGGYMINWIAGNTDRFKCLVNHDGVFNPWSMYGTTEELWFVEWEYGGTPYRNPELYNRWSPLLNAGKFKTPMLVVHGQQDFRVDVSEGFQVFTALQRQGVKSKMLYFPDEGHWVLKPANAELWYKTILDWIDEHVKPGQAIQ
ncbi:MAG: prolyl oligopeptidase family serine peptidase, partial [Bacteroidota bacterium]